MHEDKLYDITFPFASIARDIESLFTPKIPGRSEHLRLGAVACFESFHRIIARVILYFKLAATNSIITRNALLLGIPAFAARLGISGLTGRKMDGPTRAFHKMQEDYIQFGEKYIERVGMMYPNLKGTIEAWRRTNKIPSRTPMSPTEFLKIRELRISRHKIKFVMEVRKKLNKTRCPPLPDPDCIPLRVQDGKILIGKYDSAGRFNIQFTPIATIWRGAADRLQAVDDFKRGIMYLNDNEFDEYLKLSGLS